MRAKLHASMVLWALGSCVSGAEVGQPKTSFGRQLLSRFDMDSDYINVNQGSYGSTPSSVREATERLVLQTERNPDLWFRAGLDDSLPANQSTYTQMLTSTRARVAKYLGTRSEDTVIVDNASHGINAILRSVPALLAKKGILHLDLAYFEVKRACAFLGLRGHTVHQVNTSSLGTDFENTHALISLLTQALSGAGDIGFCVFSHIVSVPAIVLPVEALASACRAYGALTLVDGAHVPGNLGPQVLHPIAADNGPIDFWVGNGHKHFYSSRGVCFLWARSGRPQALLSPLVIDSGGAGTPFEQSFGYQGTTDDFTRYIAAASALDFREELGGEDKVREWTSGLASAACTMLADSWNTRRLPDNLQANMCNVELPCRDQCPERWGYELFHKYHFYAAMFKWAGTTWFRLTASVYNELADYEIIKAAVLENCSGSECHNP